MKSDLTTDSAKKSIMWRSVVPVVANSTVLNVDILFNTNQSTFHRRRVAYVLNLL